MGSESVVGAKQAVPLGCVLQAATDHDRATHKDGTITRLHQEHFCQALGVPPELKYQEEGGPGTEPSLDLIDRATARPAADRLAFIRALIFHYYLVGNADAHGKNYALLFAARFRILRRSTMSSARRPTRGSRRNKLCRLAVEQSLTPSS